MMKKTRLLLLVSSLAARRKYALVIGNGAYTGITRRNNPLNDTNDMKAVLQGLGFTVDTVVNGSRVQMKGAVTRSKIAWARCRVLTAFSITPATGYSPGAKIT
jgi:hypothetical protein